MTEKKTKSTGSGYGAFLSNLEAEQTGVILDYGTFRVTIARAGGSNKSYERIMTALTKPHSRAIATETLSARISTAIMQEALAKAVILNWEILVGDDKTDEGWKQGLEDPSTGEFLTFGWENVLKVLQHPELQNLYNDLRIQSGKEALFLQEAREDEGKR